MIIVHNLLLAVHCNEENMCVCVCVYKKEKGNDDKEE
jgi:hypothetical protein